MASQTQVKEISFNFTHLLYLAVTFFFNSKLILSTISLRLCVFAQFFWHYGIYGGLI